MTSLWVVISLHPPSVVAYKQKAAKRARYACWHSNANNDAQHRCTKHINTRSTRWQQSSCLRASTTS